MARQQALSSWLITTLVKQAITGAAAVSSRRIAAMLERRRMARSSIRPSVSKPGLPIRLLVSLNSRLFKTGQITHPGQVPLADTGAKALI
jgi:hypothetical protein